MNLTLKPRVFLTVFVPGFLFIIGFIFIYKGYSFLSFKDFAKEISIFSGIAIVILSCIVGLFFDSIRDILVEGSFRLIYNKLKKKKKKKKMDINWDFFYKGTNTKIDRLDNNYYLFYLVTIDLTISLLSILIMIIIDWPNVFPSNFIITKFYLIICFVVVLIVLILDARYLRNEIVKHTNSIN